MLEYWIVSLVKSLKLKNSVYKHSQKKMSKQMDENVPWLELFVHERFLRDSLFGVGVNMASK